MRLETIEIILKVKKGDQSAFRKLVELHQQYAFNLAFRIICNEEEAKDIVQESFIKIWQKINDYNPKLKFATWMYRIVTNSAIDRLRVIKRNIIVDLENVSGRIDQIMEENPETNLNNKELGTMINFIAEELPEKQRLVFILRDIQGFDSFEVKNILSLPETSVKSNLYHARKTIREKLMKIMVYERREK